MSYTVKFVVIISIVGVVSFFTASLVIPEKNAVAPSRKSASKVLMPPPASRSGGDILVVVADGKPSDKLIAESGLGSGVVPPDHNALAPSAGPDAAAAAAKAVRPSGAGAAQVDPRALAAAAPTAGANVLPPPAATAADPVMFSPQTDTADVPEAVSFVGRTSALPDAKSSPPPNTMIARLIAEAEAAAKVRADSIAAAAAAKVKADSVAAAFAAKAALSAVPPPPAPPAGTQPVPIALSITVPPADTVKKRPDPNAPLGYRLVSTAVCSGVENRAPKDVADKFSKDVGAVYYFTHIAGAADTSLAVMHKWYREGKLIQTSILQIRSASWRTHSKRNLATVDDPTGNWRVDAVDQRSGKVLSSTAFVIE